MSSDVPPNNYHESLLLISQSSSLGSLPSLTDIFTPPAISSPPSLNTHFLSSCNIVSNGCQCLALTLHLPLDDGGHVSCLTSARRGSHLYGGSSSSSTIYVWSMEDLHLQIGSAAGNYISQSSTATNSCIGVKLGGQNPAFGGVRALVSMDDQHMIVTAHTNDNKLRVWKRSSPSHENGTAQRHMHIATEPVLAALYNAYNIGPGCSRFKMLSTLPTVKDYLRTFLLEKNYVQVRRHHKKVWIQHVDTVSALALSKDKRLLFSASWDRSIKVWRLPQYKCVESVRNAHADAINCMVLSDNGRFLYTGSADGKIKVWAAPQSGTYDGHSCHYNVEQENNVDEGIAVRSTPLAQAMVSTLEGHKSAVNALTMSPDGNVLYSGAGDKAIIVWESRKESTEHMVIAGTLRGHRQAILCLNTAMAAPQHQYADQNMESVPTEFYPQPQHELHILVSGSADKTIRVWKRGSPSTRAQYAGDQRDNYMMKSEYKYWCVAVLEGHTAPVKCLTTSVDTFHNLLYVYSASLDKTIKVWRILISTIQPSIQLHLLSKIPLHQQLIKEVTYL